jgi:hypothetical protein
MLGFVIFGFLIYNVWKSLGGKYVKDSVAKADVGAGSVDGGREDYIRGYYVGSEREPDGFGQNFDGYRSGARH